MILVPTPVLGCYRTPPPPGPPPVFTNTVFLADTGDDSTGQTNDPARPYATLAAAVNALSNGFPGTPVVLGFTRTYHLSDFDTPDVSQYDNLLASGLTWQGYSGGRTTISGNVSFGTLPNANLTLTNVAVDTISKAEQIGGFGTVSAGQITGHNTTIGSVTVNGGGGSGGIPGADADPQFGGNGDPGQDGAPPSDGMPAPDVQAIGGGGGAGSDGNRAWDVTLRGTMHIGSVSATGGSGGAGGSGGSGGFAQGGTGGAGGNATDDGAGHAFDGGNGGAGGSTTTNGGTGGTGGNGGNGGNITSEAGVSVDTYFVAGGAGGSGGSGGFPGSGAPGGGGNGGAGVNGGASGNSGPQGVGPSDNGATGSTGNSGNPGSVS